MSVLGNGLADANHHEDALSVGVAELAMMRRIGAPEDVILDTQGNLATTYEELGRLEPALRLRRDVYLEFLQLYGEENGDTLREANNYAWGLVDTSRFEEAKSLLRKTVPVARRILGEDHRVTLKMRWVNAKALCDDSAATLDDLREAVTTIEEIDSTARRVLGGAHPLTTDIGRDLRAVRAALRGASS